MKKPLPELVVPARPGRSDPVPGRRIGMFYRSGNQREAVFRNIQALIRQCLPQRRECIAVSADSLVAAVS